MNNKLENIDQNILDEIFPDDNSIDKTKLQITTEGTYSVSGKIASKLLVEIIYKYMKKNKNITITDGTGNVGSDSLMLAKYFDNINTIELDKLNFSALKNNIDVYGYKNIHAINGNTLDELNKLKQDVIYIDAPWGGRDYKKHKSLKLYLGSVELSDIYNKFKSHAKLFIFKLPYNYDINHFIIKTHSAVKMFPFVYNKRVRFMFMVVKDFIKNEN